MKIEKKVWPEYFQKIIEGVMENSVDYVTVHSNRQELSVLERAQDAANILTSLDREFGTKNSPIIQILCTYVGKTKSQTFWSKEDVEKYGFQIISFK